jgi:diguanylate cyclase (GGDEF)-like protein
VPPAIYRAALFDRASAAPYLHSILVLDQNGEVVADAQAPVPQKLNLADRKFFILQRENPNLGFHISRVLISRRNPGELILGVSRRIPTLDGHFAGVISGGLRISYFRDLFNKINVGPRGTITLLRTDGRIIYRYPLGPNDIDQDMSGSPVFKQFMAAPAGEFISRGNIDHTPRLFSFRRVGNLPLIINVSTSMDDIYVKWWPKAMTIGGILFLLSGATLALCLMVRREISRRVTIEDALEVMATTDGLTRLLNRRAFDTELDKEWKRAMRTHTPISLLMLDADHFKLYNDQYGHQAGDAVLRAIARTIQNSLGRPRDVAARFGGEEFVVLLPETQASGAHTIAERIHAAIAALAIVHDGNANVGHASGYVTVSIGIAVGTPYPGDDPAGLIRRADHALYAAKEGGRNQIALWTALETDPAI